MRRAFSCEKPDSGTRVSVGELGQEEIREVREGVRELGEEMEGWELGGGIGIGVNVASMIGSLEMDVTISLYHS